MGSMYGEGKPDGWGSSNEERRNDFKKLEKKREKPARLKTWPGMKNKRKR